MNCVFVVSPKDVAGMVFVGLFVLLAVTIKVLEWWEKRRAARRNRC